jgi:hypothetical protein
VAAKQLRFHLDHRLLGVSPGEATPELVAKLERGQTLQVLAIDHAGDAVTFELPLSDTSRNSFRSAHEGPPSDPVVFQERQKKYRKTSRSSAEELRKKLEGETLKVT